MLKWLSSHLLHQSIVFLIKIYDRANHPRIGSHVFQNVVALQYNSNKGTEFMKFHFRRLGILPSTFLELSGMFFLNSMSLVNAVTLRDRDELHGKALEGWTHVSTCAYFF
jgi:hypothetical protein